MKYLRKRGIKLTDCDNHISQTWESEIHLLIGGDVAGKLLNKKIHYLSERHTCCNRLTFQMNVNGKIHHLLSLDHIFAYNIPDM